MVLISSRVAVAIQGAGVPDTAVGDPNGAPTGLRPRVLLSCSGLTALIETMDDMITIDDFQALDLRVGTVTSAEPHPNADRLMVLKVDLGSEERQLVAGIRGHYSAEELTGRQLVVVANLKPARLRGIESQGMILAASAGDQLVILAPEQRIAPGAKVS